MLGLRRLDELLDARRIRLPVTVTGDGIRAARALDEDVRPEETRLHVHRCDALKVDAHLVLREPGAFPPDYRRVGNLDDGRKEEIAPRPATGGESFDGHDSSYREVVT